MSTFPFALVVSQSALAEHFDARFTGEGFEYNSALPGAPVVTHDAPARPPRAVRTRTALAATLRRAAEVVAPPAACTPAH